MVLKETLPPAKQKNLILFLAGLCLILLQFFMIREVTALLTGTELVIFLVAVAYFSGYSVGYILSDKLSLLAIRRFTLLFWIIHLSLPFSLRYWMGSVATDLPSVAFVFIIFFTAFALSSFYSLLLPRFIDMSSDGADSLASLYSIELIGAIFGLIVVFLFGSITWLQPVIYQIALAAIVILIIGGNKIKIVAGFALVIYGFSFTTLDFKSLAYHYTHFHGIPGCKILYSVNSPYQKIDIVESAFGERYIYLDGKKNYGSTGLKLFNVFLSQTPANLVKPKNALALGAGSLEAIKYVGSVADRLRIVDIDGAVPEGSKSHFKYTNKFDEYDNWVLTIDDAKSFLNETDELFDLVTVDIPAPLQIQTGLLHSVEFYEMVKERLAPGGVISISLSGTFKRTNKTPRTVAAALTRVFDEVLIFTPDVAHRSFAIAGDKLPFTREDLIREAVRLGAVEVRVFDKTQAINIIGTMPPITYNDVSYPLKRSIRRVRKSYFSSKGSSD